MRKILLLVVILFANLLYAQNNTLKDKLYKLEDRLIAGDTAALRETGLYLDDKSFVQEFLGYHNYPNTARGVALRILSENCLLKNQFQFDSTASTAGFLQFLNQSPVVFDDLAGAFLVVPIRDRRTNYQLKEISESELAVIDTVVVESPYPGWYYQNQIDGFLLNKDPQALLWIASAWYTRRSRFNRYYFADEEFLGLMKKLTHVEIGVPAKEGKITFLYKDDYYAVARLNYLIYWAAHYTDYQWNERKGFFENIKETAAPKSKEEILFTILSHENDSLALDAFTQLSELDPDKVSELSDEYERNRIDVNFMVPIFPFRFLKQMVMLTGYCRDNNIRYKPVGWLADSLEKLKDDLEYPERYRLENDIIRRLSHDEVTMVEYFGLVNEMRFWSTYSVGRILDKFYSAKWQEMIATREWLALYLKKSMLFDNLGIIGICNKYLRKFENCTPDVLNTIKGMIASGQDADIREQAQKVVTLYSAPVVQKAEVKKRRIARYGVQNLQGKISAIMQRYKNDNDERTWQVKKLLAKISYPQIGAAIQMLLKDTSIDSYDKFWFIGNDFGLDVNRSDTGEISDFLNNYLTKTEYSLYEIYLKRTGIGCIDSSGNLDFKRIYDVLKYDVVDAFVGGGGGRREEGIYPVIRLLELTFNTTLGFSKKLCDSQGVYSCNCIDRARAWRKFLEERKLIIPNPSEPVSISFNE